MPGDRNIQEKEKGVTMRKKIIMREAFTTLRSRYTPGSVKLTLSCGHTIVRKASTAPNWEARCPSCEIDAEEKRRKSDNYLLRPRA